jgi:polyphosphate kinase 2 (PPK2 family)
VPAFASKTSIPATRSIWARRTSHAPRKRSPSAELWKERFQDIRSFERYLTRNGVVIRKFFLHASKGEQKRRFLERLENPEKNVAAAVIEALDALDLHYPKVSKEKLKELAAAKQVLLGGKE